MKLTLADAIAHFGHHVKAKLNDPSATGEPEDQLRGPLENLLTDINALIGIAAEDVKAIGEVRLPDLMTRPECSHSPRPHRFYRSQGAWERLGPNGICAKIRRPPAVGQAEVAAQHYLHGRQRLHTLA
jgi:hypothetical protein